MKKNVKEYKTVIDTSVIISAIAFGGTPREVLNLAVTGKISNYISEDIIDEVKEVLQRHKFGYDTLKIKAVVHELDLISEYINPERIADAMNHANFSIQDYDDNYIIACAFAAQAGYLITGDSDLLVLKEDLRQRLKILTPREFIKDFKQEK